MKAAAVRYYLALVALLACTLIPECSTAERAQRVWPVGGTSAPDAHSSPFGPRQKASEGFRYDWHRGVDLPTPLRTELVAIDDGVVVIDGEHPGYSDGVVQIKHVWDGVSYYANYLHVNASLVVLDEAVAKGQAVALSGKSVSGFPHVHFEIRRDGRFQKNCINPWGELPYSDAPESLEVEVASVEQSGTDTWTVVVNAAQARSTLDMNGVSVEIVDTALGTSIFSRALNFNDITLATEEPLDLDEEVQNDILIEPEVFSSSGPDEARYVFTFMDVTAALPACGFDVVARVFDVFDNTRQSSRHVAGAGPCGSPAPSASPVPGATPTASAPPPAATPTPTASPPHVANPPPGGNPPPSGNPPPGGNPPPSGNPPPNNPPGENPPPSGNPPPGGSPPPGSPPPGSPPPGENPAPGESPPPTTPSPADAPPDGTPCPLCPPLVQCHAFTLDCACETTATTGEACTVDCALDGVCEEGECKKQHDCLTALPTAEDPPAPPATHPSVEPALPDGPVLVYTTSEARATNPAAGAVLLLMPLISLLWFL